MVKKGTKTPEKDNDELIIFHNEDKENHEKYDGRKKRLVAPFRAILASGVNSGKTSLIKNIILNADPPFEKIYLWHFDNEHTKEYDMIDVIKIKTPLTKEDIATDEKKLLIMEDLHLGQMSKQTQLQINRMFGYMSTHGNMSIIITAQNPFDIPIDLRRMASHLFLWNTIDDIAKRTLGQRFGMKAKELTELLDKHCNSSYDNIVLDLTPNAPFMRKNLTEVIKEKR